MILVDICCFGVKLNMEDCDFYVLFLFKQKIQVDNFIILVLLIKSSVELQQFVCCWELSFVLDDRGMVEVMFKVKNEKNNNYCLINKYIFYFLVCLYLKIFRKG